VGGGYDNGLLAQLSLSWLVGKAQSHGLTFIDTVTIDGDENGQIHDSFGSMPWGAYRLVKFWRPYYRTKGAEPQTTDTITTTPINETVDASVFERWRQDPAYRPKNLLERSARRQIDPGTLHASVRTDDPKTAIAD
jgi:hypothetical protein